MCLKQPLFGFTQGACLTQVSIKYVKLGTSQLSVCEHFTSEFTSGSTCKVEQISVFHETHGFLPARPKP